jgi:DNA repair exonuclease SbcCD ATPase subunit
MFSDVYQLQSQMAKEQQEYMDALNRQEVAEKEMKSQQQEYNTLYAEVQSLQNQCEELQKVRAEREKKLDEIFDGKYGSELEGQLERETDLLTERKEIISKSRNYWNNAKILMEHAAQQLVYSTRRWAQINTVSQSMVQVCTVLLQKLYLSSNIFDGMKRGCFNAKFSATYCNFLSSLSN